MKCFLCDNTAVPTLNTFIVLDVIIQVLKERMRGRKARKRKKKKVLYLTNKRLTEMFPPNFNFILQFLNGQLNQKGKMRQGGEKDERNNRIDERYNKIDEENNRIDEGNNRMDEENNRNDEGNNRIDERNNKIDERNNRMDEEKNRIDEEKELDPLEELTNQAIQWNIERVKDIKKGILKKISHFDPKMKEKVTIKEFKDLLKNIHIKYIEKEEESLMKILYKLNEDKKYDFVIVNLAFLFVKDKKKVNIYIENFGLYHAHNNVKGKYCSILNNTNETLSRNHIKNHVWNTQMEREIYDDPFFKYILSFHFYYSFLVNFEEYLNNQRIFTSVGNSMHVHKEQEQMRPNSGARAYVTDTYDINNYDTNHCDINHCDINHCDINHCDINHCDINHCDINHCDINHCDINNYGTNNYDINTSTGADFEYQRSMFSSCGQSYDEKEKSIKRIRKHGTCTIVTKKMNNNCNLENNSDVKKRKLLDTKTVDFHNSFYSGFSLAKLDADMVSTTDIISNGTTECSTHTNGILNGDNLKNSIQLKKKNGKRTKRYLYTYDVIPKSDMHKKMYMNIISMYSGYVYLIS
ncbi:hypothetical protein, conserved [Plasmodium gonderi]|uniref:Uncharacterized protein n=1 Tax=Plasmodium gonderi TaxID=77519 RepID=A0A1Y1JFQ5_PLAGO|nr:hypothetical protein, conserved [Plasmodium gonderi]GAW81080.1 hypothetical protein, conserved [Plasmodium gonderi]